MGFAGVLLNWPLLTGLGMVDFAWLPAFNGELYSWGFWFIYAGLALAIGTTVYYAQQGIAKMRIAMRAEWEGAGNSR